MIARCRYAGEQAVGPLPFEVDGGALRRQRQVVDLERHPEVAGRLLDDEVEVVDGELGDVGAVGDRPHRRQARQSPSGAISRARHSSLTSPWLIGCGERRTGSADGGDRISEAGTSIDVTSAAGSTRSSPAIERRAVGPRIDAQGVGGEVEEVADRELGAGRDLHTTREGRARRCASGSSGGVSLIEIVSSVVCCDPNDTT